MIVDWAENCEKIYFTKKLLTEDPSDNKSKYKQELVFLKYLIDVMKLDKPGCFEEWKKLENGVASLFADDNIMLEVQFNKMYRKAINARYTKLNYKKKLEPITIFQEEIDFLNKLKAPLWVRQYWGCLLFYYKFESQNTTRVLKSQTLNSWAIRQTEYKAKRYGSKCQDVIAKYKKELSVKIITDFIRFGNDHYPSYKPEFIVEDGMPVFTSSSIDDVDGFIELIADSVSVCTECGKIFTINSKTQRDLCDECYRKQRNGVSSSEKANSSEKICAKCGKIFYSGLKGKKDLCDECYKKQRNKIKEPILQTLICENCGKKFQSGTKCQRKLCNECYKEQRKEYLNQKKREERAKIMCQQQKPQEKPQQKCHCLL